MTAGSLFISAGDPSGDNATSRLVAELHRHHPSLRLSGLGGPKLRAQGQEQLADYHELAVLGFWEVVQKYRFFRSLLAECGRQIETQRPACVLLVDYPGFNLRLAAKVKALGIPVVYYISPQIWAWHKSRIHQIKQLVDLMLINLPFEKQLYDDHEVPNELVGHYLLEDIPDEFIGSDRPGSRQVALLPGSRGQEIDRMLVPMLEGARQHNRQFGTSAVVVGIEGRYDYEAAVAPYRDDRVTIAYGDSRQTMYESDTVLAASGTATLEAAIIGRPMVIMYKTGLLTYLIARRVVTLESIGLVNLVLGQPVVPELIQYETSPDNIATALARYESDPEYTKSVTEQLHRVPELLGRRPGSARAAELVGQYL